MGDLIREKLHNQQDMSFSVFAVSNPTTDLIQSKLMGLTSYFDGVDYSRTREIQDFFYWSLQGGNVYKVNVGGIEYYGARVTGNEYQVRYYEPYVRIVNVVASNSKLMFNPFLGANPQRFAKLYGMSTNGIGRRLDSSGQIKLFWKTAVASGLKKVWDNIRQRLSQQQELAREFGGVSVIGENDDIKQIQPDFSGSLQNDGNMSVELALAEYGIPRELLYGQSKEVDIISFTIQKVQPILKQIDSKIEFNNSYFVAYISTTGKGDLNGKGSTGHSQPNRDIG